MGTDIHMRIEKRDSADSSWEVVLPPVKKRNYDGGRHYRSWYHDRNYTVFSVLADVRNGHGFAGVYTGEPLEPISEPRGLPSGVPEDLDCGYEDGIGEGKPYVDPEGLAEVRYRNDDNLGDHSFTHFFAGELLNAPQWRQPHRRGGVLSLYQYKLLKETGKPSEWSGDVSGPGIIKLPPKGADHLLDCGYAPPPEDIYNPEIPRFYTSATWEVGGGTEESCASFIHWMDEELRPLAEKYGQDNVRVLIGFDS